MGDFPNFQDLFRVGRDEALVRNGKLTKASIEREGGDANILNAAAAAVGAAGIVGFVGLVAPHAARLVVGPGHRRLVPTAALVGAVLVLLADLFARTVASPLELPIGVVTALVGAPFFLYLLAKRGAGSGAGSAGGRGGGR